MIVAEVIVDGDLFSYAQDAMWFLVLVVGALFLITTVVFGQNPISSGHLRRRRLLPGAAWAGAAGGTEELSGRQLRGVPKHPKGGREKRRSLRRGGISVPVLVANGQPPAEPEQGLVLNRSRGGLRLSVPQKMDVGTLITVRTLDFPEGLEPVQLRVRHCKQHSDGWHLGCQFVDELPWNVLLLFG